MTKIPNWSRADEKYSNSDIIMAWEHDRIAQRVFIEKRDSVRGASFYSIQQQNFPSGFEEQGYIEEVDNPTFDTRDEATDAARSQLRRFSDGFTIAGLTDINVEDLPVKENAAMNRSGDIDASDSDSVSKATNELREKFEAFENHNEQFHYNKTVVDQDGYKVAILVDFGVEDYETGGYYMGNVMATREDQPTQDAEDIAMSNAFYKAQEIVENAAVRGLTDMSRRDAKWGNHEDGEHVDASLAIIFNESNL